MGRREASWTGALQSARSTIIRHLSVSNLRNLADVRFDFADGANIILGPNGAGKTSVLEAIHLLAHGRSFRAGRPQNLIRSGETALTVRVDVRIGPGSNHRLALERSARERVLRVDGDTVEQIADVALHLPALIFEPHAHRLVEGGPEERRRLIDWGLFHVEHQFLENWRAYQRVLRQRNAALRRGERSRAGDWVALLERHGEILSAQRARYVQMISEMLPKWLDMLAPELKGMEISYRPGWPVDKTLGEVLRENEAQDCESGYTTVGPHRAEMPITLAQCQAAKRLSRGQEKLLAIALLLTQGAIFCGHTSRRPVLLLDDLPSELDAEHLQRAVAASEQLGCQIFATALEWPKAFEAWRPVEVFHVEQGTLRKMV